MSVSLAGSAQGVQQSLNVVRQNIQVDQIASAAAVEASSQAGKISVQEATVSREVTPADDGRGQHVDIRA